MTHDRIAPRSVLPALLLGLCGAVACFDESVLENEDCAEAADCASNQECIGTPYQLQLPEPVGWCRPDGDGCSEGNQPGCSCEADGVNLCCRGTEVGTLAPFVGSDGVCICVFSNDADFPTMPELASGCVPS